MPNTNNLKAIDLIHVRSDSKANPVIQLSGDYYPFQPGQIVQAKIYDNKVVITLTPLGSSCNAILIH